MRQVVVFNQMYCTAIIQQSVNTGIPMMKPIHLLQRLIKHGAE